MNGTTKQKSSKPQPPPTGIYKADSVKDVAESLGITTLPDHVAAALSSDVEYRLHQVIEEASRFMRHARRSTMTTSDIDHALRVLNIEPLYGNYPQNPPAFRRAGVHGSQPVYFVEDEEIDFDRVLREEKIVLPKGVSWSAHWLAVEGVQPLIPENPPQAPVSEQRRRPSPPRSILPNSTTLSHSRKGNKAPLVKHVLSRELQLYYNRLTSSLIPPNDIGRRTAALASLRHDAGLQTLLPYLVRWVGERVVATLRSENGDGRVLEVLLEVLGALLDNQTLFVEPYLHQILPPILSVLLTSSLSLNPPTLRYQASQILSHLLTQHSTTYPSLSERLTKTLLVALLAPEKSRGTREGAVRGLAGVGREAVRRALVEGGGAKVVGSETQEETDGAVLAVMDALGTLHPTSSPDQTVRLDPSLPADAETLSNLRGTFGEYFAANIAGDAEWARALLKHEEGESASVDRNGPVSMVF